jgi:hypothetical protein
VTTLVLPNGRRVRVRQSAKEIRARLHQRGYIRIGRVKLRREQVLLICVENELVEDRKRRLLSRRWRAAADDRSASK